MNAHSLSRWSLRRTSIDVMGRYKTAAEMRAAERCGRWVRRWTNVRLQVDLFKRRNVVPVGAHNDSDPRGAAWWSVAQLALRVACAVCSVSGPVGCGRTAEGLGAWKHGGAGEKYKKARGVAGRAC